MRVGRKKTKIVAKKTKVIVYRCKDCLGSVKMAFNENRVPETDALKNLQQSFPSAKR